ncbi:MAG: autotransporter domain-containing protein [Bradyrhizobium sp.]|uniref:autotransporter family protein n=1 Tax=Bradyrhizobium sp. TaxID=376 RepID=UPI0025C369EC|nr:autotransporter outer membrane beta-barrel domain-containing protein [Bradyrhizobium sp.]MBI5263193.1 autotransporter domain-containing protein [Bradyrhizobium sp.]
MQKAHTLKCTFPPFPRRVDANDFRFQLGNCRRVALKPAGNTTEAAMRKRRLRRVELVLLPALIVALFLSAEGHAQTWVGITNDWGTATNWAPATVPNAVDTTATFNSTVPGSSQGVFLTGGPFTVGTLNLNASAANSNYLFQTGTLIMQTSAGSAAINVQSTGGQTDFLNFSTLQLNSNTVITTASASATFTMGAQSFVTGTGSLTIAGPGTVSFYDAASYTGGTTINSGSTLQLLHLGPFSGSIVGNVVNNGTLAIDRSANYTFSGNISGSGALQQNGTGTLILTGTNTYSGGTTINDGKLEVGNNGTSGSISGDIINNSLLSFVRSDSYTFGGNISGSGTLVQEGSGTTILTGNNTYSGATILSVGTFEVDGSITNTASVTVDSFATLSGIGTIGGPGATTAVYGSLAPGNAGNPTGMLTITGELAFQSGALYLLQVTPSAASSTSVSGTATLAGTVNATFAPGSYVSKQYTILTATGGVSGTFDPTVVNANLPANFHTTLSYDANNAYLNLDLNFSIPGGLNRNQQAVGNALTNYFNSNGSIPFVYGGLAPGGLTQASGESGSGSQQTTFNAMGQFMGLLTDPFADRSGTSNPNGSAPAFADEHEPALAYAGTKGRAAEREAYALFTKAPRTSFERRWSVWAAGFGGSQSTDGNAAVGSNNVTSRIFGTAVGADYRFSPNTLAGFALAGGGTNFSVNGLGSGRSELFQAGAYVRHNNGPAYISAALAYGWQDITTDRTVTIAGTDQLRARFNANAYSGRVEGGYRFIAPAMNGIGISPYAAAQFATFDLPAYAEQVLAGTGAFALSYGAKSVTDTRSELGLRTDKSFAVRDGVLTLRSRLAWAHDFNPDRSIAATFQALPGASFVVNGAAQAADSALTTASAEMKWLNGWMAAATFEGEFSNVTRSYAGKGVVRYAW